VKEAANGFMRFPHKVKKALLVNFKGANEILLHTIQFALKGTVFRQIQAKTGVFGIVVQNGQGWRENGDVVEIDGRILVGESCQLLPVFIGRKGAKVNITDFKGLIGYGKNHLIMLGESYQDRRRSILNGLSLKEATRRLGEKASKP
jgi:hypothetical protein